MTCWQLKKKEIDTQPFACAASHTEPGGAWEGSHRSCRHGAHPLSILRCLLSRPLSPVALGSAASRAAAPCRHKTQHCPKGGQATSSQHRLFPLSLPHSLVEKTRKQILLSNLKPYGPLDKCRMQLHLCALHFLPAHLCLSPEASLRGYL